MTPTRRRALTAGVALLASGAGIGWGWWTSRRDPAIAALRAAAFPDLAGRTRNLTEWQGRVVVLNFWATWCAPCREEIPILMETGLKRAGDGVQIVGIALDNAANVREYASNMKITYPLLLAEGAGLDLIRQLGNPGGGLPYTAFLDRGGRPVRTKLGALKQPELDALLGEVLQSG